MRLRLLLAGGMAIATWIAAPADAAPRDRGAILTVNDTDGIGKAGDDRLSLGEAIRLANGSLSIQDLSTAEQRQVKGVPGAARRDRILFSVTGGAVRFPLQVQKKPSMDFAVLDAPSLIPAMTGNEGDEIRGNGIRFTNGPDDAADTVNETPLFKGAPLGGTALIVESSNLSIRGVIFERFIHGISFRPAEGSEGLENIRLMGNSFRNGGGVSFTGVSAGRERSALRNILVRGNAFLGPGMFGGSFPSKLHSAISITGANAAVAGPDAAGRDVILEDIRIERNTVREFSGGVQVQPLQTLYATNRGVRLTRLVIAGNDISLSADAGDPAVYLWGAVAVNGEVSDVRISDILVENNRIIGNGHIVFLTGVEAIMGGTAPSGNIEMANVRILGNRISPRTSCSHGITTSVAFPEMNGPPSQNNVLRDVQVSENAVTGCRFGIMATPVLNVGAPGASSGNRIDGILLERNVISQAETAILVAGGVLMADKFETVAEVEANNISGARIRKNIVGASETGILVAGGFAAGNAEGKVRANRVDITEIAGNRARASDTAAVCRIEENIMRDGPAIVQENSVVSLVTDCLTDQKP